MNCPNIKRNWIPFDIFGGGGGEWGGRGAGSKNTVRGRSYYVLHLSPKHFGMYVYLNCFLILPSITDNKPWINLVKQIIALPWLLDVPKHRQDSTGHARTFLWNVIRPFVVLYSNQDAKKCRKTNLEYFVWKQFDWSCRPAFGILCRMKNGDFSPRREAFFLHHGIKIFSCK